MATVLRPTYVMAPSLSPRERQILEIVAEGLTSKAIAARLGIGESTVNWHLANTLRKLGASSRAEAVAIAMRDSLFSEASAPVPPAQSFASERRRWQVLLAMSVAAIFATPVLIATAMFGPSFGPQDLVPPARPATQSPAGAPSTVPTATATPTQAPPTPAPSAAVPMPVPPPAQLPAPTSTPAGVEAPFPVLTTPVLPAPVLATPAVPTPVLATPALATPPLATPTLAPVLPGIPLPLPTPRLP